MVFGTALLQPVVVLAAWTFVMLLWMYATRIPAMQAAKVDLDEVSRTGQKIELPAAVSRVADNYNHLHEAPTVFYAVALAGAAAGISEGWVVMTAWVYVALRIVHSLIQATANKIIVRFGTFLLSSIVQLALIIGVAQKVFA